MSDPSPLTAERLGRAGWLAFINALITIPLFLFSLMLSRDSSYGARAAQTILALAVSLLFIYIMLTLLDYLNGIHRFHQVDLLVKLMIWSNIAIAVWSMLGLLSEPLRELGGIFTMGLIIPSGIIQALFGYRLLRLPDPLGGKLKPYCLLNIITGISIAVMVLMPLGILTSVAGDVILGSLLLQAAEEQG